MEKSTCFLLFQFVLLRDVAEKLSIAAVLHDEKELVGRLNNLIQLDDMWMSHNFEDVELTTDPLNIVYISYLALFKYFDCHLNTQ